MITYTNSNKELAYNRVEDVVDVIFSSNASNYKICNRSISKSVYVMSNAEINFQLTKNYWKLEEISKLNNNWNKNGAKKFSDSIIENMKKVLMDLSVQPDIYPTANESIQFEYENNKGDYLEFELFETSEVKVFFYDHKGTAWTKYIEIGDINGEVEKFVMS